MPDIRQYTYKVESRDIDFSNRAKITSLYDYALQAAFDDADRNGFGVDSLLAEQHTWIISRMSMEASGKLLKKNEMVRVGTWINEIRHALTTRNMELCNEQGEKVADAFTQWAIIDFQTRRPLDLQVCTAYKGVEQDIPSSISRPIKVLPVTQPNFQTTHQVVYSDLDFNRHVNSVRYLQWMIDLLPLSIIESRHFFRLDMNYLHEALYGDSVEILCMDTPDDSVSFFEMKSVDNLSICRAKITWR